MQNGAMMTVKTKPSKLVILLAVTLGIAAAFADDSKPEAAKPLPPPSKKTGVTYAANIKLIFDGNCIDCHSSTKKAKAHLELDSLAGVLKGSRDGAVVIPGNSAKSQLVLSVAHVGDDPDTFMPKGKHAHKLSDEQIGLIRAWIDQGAK
jgi:mono/diheme cytochrome c family protein